MDNFITLTSDASLDLFPDNRIGAFRLKLPHPIVVDHTKFQIGLYSVNFPNKLPNVVDGRFKVRAIADSRETTIVGPNGESVTMIQGRGHVETKEREIASGYYSSPQQLIDCINEQIYTTQFRDENLQFCDPSTEFVKFEYDQTTEKASLVRNGGPDCDIRIQLSTDLFIKLGFGLTESERRFIRAPLTAPHTVDLGAGHNSIFLYTDIVKKNRIVGGQITDLLAVIPIIGGHNTNCHHAPNVIEYRDLRYDKIEEINIVLAGDTGEILPFQSGKVILTLHIREKF